MISFRDETAKRLGVQLIVHVNDEGVRGGINPFDSGSSDLYACDEDGVVEAGA